MKYLVLLLFFIGLQHQSLAFQLNDTTSSNLLDSAKRYSNYAVPIDSAALARKNFIADSLTWYYLKPDPARPNPYFKKLLEDNLNPDRRLISIPKNQKFKISNYGSGQYLMKSGLWFFPMALLLIVIFGVIRIAFYNDLQSIFRAFYDNRILKQISTEENNYISWQFLFLYIIFSLITGLFICILIYKLKNSETATKFNIYLTISAGVFIFFGFKILLLRLVGFLFEMQKLIREYITLIYISCFNSIYLLIPGIVCLTLINFNKEYFLINSFVILLGVVIAMQFIRILLSVLINYKFPKFYLIIYLCALEICPVIIFSRIIDNSL